MGPGAFRGAYSSALADYLREPGEAALRTAYELGRDAVRQRLSVLDLALAHHEALLSSLAGAPSSAHTQQVVRAAGDFFLESLSAYEMVQRGFGEARESARAERRQTELSRQLSSFLADTSLALEASGSLDEMLTLVAEQGRELVGAECCLTTVAMEGRPRSAEAASYAPADRRWASLVQWLDLFEIYRLIRASGGSLRMAGEPLAALPPFRAAAGARPLRAWLAASLTTLDGGELGAIQLFDKHDGPFDADDEAALVHLAQMASAAVERVRLYRR